MLHLNDEGLSERQSMTGGLVALSLAFVQAERMQAMQAIEASTSASRILSDILMKKRVDATLG